MSSPNAVKPPIQPQPLTINYLTPLLSPNFDVDPTYGAGDETRTRDIFLGKEVLYQLSYTRDLDQWDWVARRKAKRVEK